MTPHVCKLPSRLPLISRSGLVNTRDQLSSPADADVSFKWGDVDGRWRCGVQWRRH